MSNREDQVSPVLTDLIAKALEFGADELEIEYKDGKEEVAVMKGSLGFGIASLDSSSPEAETLREELSEIEENSRTIRVDSRRFGVRVETYDSFGETAFRVFLNPI